MRIRIIVTSEDADTLLFPARIFLPVSGKAMTRGIE
jgi:hypothetical protein